MLNAIMEKLNKMQDKMEFQQKDGNYKSQMELSEMKKILTEMKNALNGLLSRLTQPKKESVSLKIGQKK